ncbi:hypothetical protein [Herpetosiphon sp. NSE202]|uniref:hypothetical protein n=1 Tax=Herpetosiphon sp. NSE202 TaxID=3351349 RepID=UPI003643B7CA
MADTSDEKKARLDAIRAANAAKKAAEGEAPAAAPAPAAPIVAATTEAPATAAVGANMSDDKKARLEAIRAAKKAAAADAPAAPVVAATPAPAAAAPVVAATPAAPATAAAPVAPKPAAPASTGNDSISANSIISLTMLGRLKRILVGVAFCVLIGLGLASVTGQYLLGGGFGALIGAVGGLMVGDWPAVKTTGD